MFGVLKSNTNTGSDDELMYVFSTPLRINSNQPAFISDTMNLKRKVNSQNVQRWEIEAEIAQTNDSPNILIHSVMNGLTEVFYIRMPQIYKSKEVPSNLNLTMSGTRQIGSKTVDISGANNNDLTGQFINFNGDSKVYLITSMGANGVGAKIAPALINAVAGNATIIYGNKTTMYARYDSDTILGIHYSDGILVNQGTMKFIEAL